MANNVNSSSSRPKFDPIYSDEPVIDLCNPDTFVNGHPYDAYARLRSSAPVQWQQEKPPGNGFWLLTRHEDIQRVSKNAEVFTSKEGFKAADESYERLGADIDAAMRRIILSVDPPEHTELRRVLLPYFNINAVREMEAETQATIRTILGRLKTGSTVNVVDAVSAELPIVVLCNILGIADEDRSRVLDWTNRMVGVDDPDFNITPEQAVAAFYEVFEFGRQAIENLRRTPGEGLLSVLANARIGGKLLDRTQTDGFMVLMVGAGNETSRNSISAALHTLARFPDQRQYLIENPDGWSTAVDELLRFVSPVIHMRRTAAAETELSGQRIAPGEKVVMLYAAANRDPEVFASPNTLDLRRKNARSQVAFGYGVHLCLGAMFARMELRLMLQEFLARFPTYKIEAEPRYLRSNFVHGIKSMDIRL